MSANVASSPKGVRFVPEVTLGHLLQVLSVAGAVVGLWVGLDKRLTALELHRSFAMDEQRELKRTLTGLAETQAALARSVDRLTGTMDERARGARSP